MISERMKNDIKNKDNCLKQAYVPASVKVIELTTQRVLCQSNGPTETDKLFDDIE